MDRGEIHGLLGPSGAGKTTLEKAGFMDRSYSVQLLARKHPVWYRQDLATLLRMLAAGDIEPRLAAVWRLDEPPLAAIGLAGGALPGKQVIAMAAR